MPKKEGDKRGKELARLVKTCNPGILTEVVTHQTRASSLSITSHTGRGGRGGKKERGRAGKTWRASVSIGSAPSTRADHVAYSRTKEISVGWALFFWKMGGSKEFTRFHSEKLNR